MNAINYCIKPCSPLIVYRFLIILSLLDLFDIINLVLCRLYFLFIINLFLLLFLYLHVIYLIFSLLSILDLFILPLLIFDAIGIYYSRFTDCGIFGSINGNLWGYLQWGWFKLYVLLMLTLPQLIFSVSIIYEFYWFYYLSLFRDYMYY